MLKAMPLGKHKGRSFSEIPEDYLSWAVRKDFDQDLIFSIKTKLKNRSKRLNFERAANPFSDL
jgi:DNA polymerase-3 subunit epsilon